MLCHELALAVIGDGRLDGVGLAVVGNAVVGVARDLAQRVGVLAGLFVLDGAHRDLAVGSVGAGGDDLGVLALALDELEGKLAVLEVASGQELGRLDLVGDAGALGGHGVGILKDRLLDALQLMLHAQSTVAVVHNRSHDSVLGGAVGNTVLGGTGLGLAQRVGVFAGLGVRDGIHHDLAVGIVGAGGDHVIALDELEAELAGHKAKLAPGQDLLRGDLVGDAGVLGTRLVRVGELGLLGVALQLMLRLERAVTLVGDGGLDGIGLAVVGDAASLALDLTQRVSVRSGLVVFDGTHRDLAAGVVGAGRNNLGALALALDELKGELAVLEVAPVQDLGRLNLVGNAKARRRHAIGVGELPVFDLRNLSRQRAGGIDGHLHGDLCDILAVSDAAQLALDLADLIGVLARLVVGDLAEIDDCMALIIQIVLGHGHSRGLGHRGATLGRRGELKRKLVRSRPVTAFEHLGQAKGGLGVHRCRRHVVLIANLAVVAQVGIDVRCARLGGRVVPLGIEHVGRGFGQVAALVGMELVNKGQACGPLAKRQVSAPVVDHAVRKLRGMSTSKFDDGGAVVELAAAIRHLKLILIVIKALARQLPLRGLRAGGIHVNGRLLLEEVVTVGGSRRKVGDRVAQVLVATPLVGIEVHGLGALLASRILLDVALQPRNLIRGEQVFARDSLNARSVLHADGLDVVDRKRALGLVDVKFAQRNQRRRDLDLYDVTLLGIALRGALNGDDQIRGFVGEGVSVDIACSGFHRIGKRLAVVLNGGKAIDLHKVAQFIGERNVAGLMTIAFVGFGRIAHARRNTFRNLVEDLLEFISAGRRLVIIRVLCARAKLAT